MRKKLVKYGNSHALVLDRAILALLNLGENAVVKLRIEGEKLIVTPDKEECLTDLVMMDIDNIFNQTESYGDQKLALMKQAVEKKVREDVSELEANPKSVENYKQWMPGTTNGETIQNSFQEIFAKYKAEMQQLTTSEEYLKELELLVANYEDHQSDEFSQKCIALQIKYMPKLADMHKELKDISTLLKNQIFTT